MYSRSVITSTCTSGKCGASLRRDRGRCDARLVCVQETRNNNSGFLKPVLFRRTVLHSLFSGAVTLGSQSFAGVASAASNSCTEFSVGEGGLQYCDSIIGEGNSPVKGALIRCHYTGRLAANNAVFDSSYNRGIPLTFKVGAGEVIRGWDLGILGAEGIPPMREAEGVRTLIIPAALAYGSRSVGGGLIPANSDLIFDVELLPPKRR
eukprot:CAMPEP_0177623914 /NCGR_PEP_ID=MMETSP0419_2-20121207/29176_1 /TAXON_ID=582737 /ORGANISM="Tetraselmis sp., Strain GSL018" /LENGTH=206 /DNA_ID=CAMNT_0019124537 /DNA_START=42 /DNA_END=663 /DNA_ORIENTATION=-